MEVKQRLRLLARLQEHLGQARELGGELNNMGLYSVLEEQYLKVGRMRKEARRELWTKQIKESIDG